MLATTLEEKHCPDCGQDVREIGREIYFCKGCDEIFTEPRLA